MPQNKRHRYINR